MPDDFRFVLDTPQEAQLRARVEQAVSEVEQARQQVGALVDVVERQAAAITQMTADNLSLSTTLLTLLTGGIVQTHAELPPTSGQTAQGEERTRFVVRGPDADPAMGVWRDTAAGWVRASAPIPYISDSGDLIIP